ncbi:MAG: hypothetical protein DRN25_02565 [Thermoplasmata archaeon]|nr:MAG: hypothetical protein DRN18_02980 [Thermoplasmata archaeon]RLF60479.1 MAG: hypothetical protein DRN25_02565 [Thermoplasmata archaeon]
MGTLWEMFLSMLMLVFSIATFIAGIFTAYFGSGRSRAIGGLLIVIGLIVGFLFADFTWFHWIGSYFAPGIVYGGVASIIGGLIGGLIGLGIFLAAIMKA